MTQGPAIRTSGLPGPKAAKSIGTGEQRLLLRGEAFHTLLVRGADECLEERVRLHRLGLEFRMELAAQEPGVVRDFADLDIGVVRRLPGDPQAGGLQALLVFAIEFVAVAMPLVDLARAV